MMDDSVLDLDGLENTVYYELHPSTAQATPGQLAELRQSIMDIILPYIDTYIWQKDPFNLQSSAVEPPPWGHVQPSAAASAKPLYCGPPCIWGEVHFGDNVEDEWFIVWMLQEVTRKLPGVLARVWDNDGEFMLIEVAHHIPSWLRPETATNRVWLYEGQLHIVPRPGRRYPSLPPMPTLRESLQIIRSENVKTLASPKAQGALADRIGSFPVQAEKHMMRARATVPAKVAHLLAREPQIVAAAVEAFHMRDMEDIRTASRFPNFPPKELRTVLVKTNRCQYAQLMQAAFEAPKAYPMPPSDSAQYRHADVGMRITSAFEMLYANRTRFERQGNEAAPMDTCDTIPASQGEGVRNPQGLTEQQVARFPAWANYKAALEARGFFEGELPGSARYREIVGIAIDRFVRTDNYRRMTEGLAAPVRRIDELLHEPVDAAALEQAGQGEEDDTEWMSSGDMDLDAELRKREAELHSTEDHQRRRKKKGEQISVKERTFEPQMFVDRLTAFVENSSGLDGAEEPAFPSDDPMAFNADAFLSEMKRALHLDDHSPEGEGEDEDDDFWGSSDDDKEDDDDGDEDDANDSTAGFRKPDSAPSLGAEAACDSFKYFSPSEIVAEVERQERKTASHKGPPSPQWGTSPDREHGAATKGSDNIKWEDVAAPNVPPNIRAFPAMQTRAELRGSARRAPGPPAGPSSSTERTAGGPPGASAGIGRTRAGPGGAGLQGAATAAGGTNEFSEVDWDARTATDSDDEGGFEEGYAEAMAAELRDTAMASTFERLPTQAESGRDDMEEDGDLLPVDVDYNLVQSLLESFSQQQGRPGPVSNLAGILGLSLPKSGFDEGNF